VLLAIAAFRPATKPSVLNESAAAGFMRGAIFTPSSSPRALVTPRVWVGSMT